MITPSWEATLASALAGTARQPLAGAHGDPERALLAAAATLAVRRLAGWQPARLEPPADGASPPENRPIVPPAAALRLAALLGGDHAELLPEWLTLAATRELLVPRRLLPALLKHAEMHAPVRQATLDVIGHRGRWLAAQVPGWSFAALADLEAAFETGPRPARAAALRELRRQDPAAALRHLAESWPTESGDDRAVLIGALGVGLGPTDEEFLEAGLSDPRQEVRHAALTYLARMPESRLVARMRERTAPLVVYRKGLLGGRLQVTPPESADPELIPDGAGSRQPKGIGEQARWLSQMLGMVPPSAWPVEAIAAAAGTDWTAALLRGWATAAARFRDVRWAEALVLHWSRLSEKERQALAFSPELILHELEPRDRDAILRRLVAHGQPADAARLALHCDHRWGAEVTRSLLRELPGLARRQGQLAAQVARLVGLRGDPSELAAAERLVANATDVPWLDHALADAADTLHWRALMARELST